MTSTTFTAAATATAIARGISLPDPFDHLPDPFASLGGAASSVGGSVGGSVATNLWTAAMLAVWNAGLFFFRLVLNLMDAWLTPDLSTKGPAGAVFGYCFWIAGSLMVVLLVAQLGAAAIRRDAKLLGRAVIGSAQFVVVWASWIGYCVLLIAACGGLTRGLLQALFGGASLSEIDLWKSFSTDSVTSAATATVLGFLGIFLVLSSLAHLLVFLVRSASLIVLVATSQISASGLVADFSRSWFWKNVRWVHAAALAPVLMVLVLGIGTKMTEGVATGLTDSTQQAIGSAVPGVTLICMSAVCPFALFKLLAFVDPGTASGSAMRQGLSAHGGIQGLLSGKKGAETGSSAASTTDEHGTSSGEHAAESATGGRLATSMKTALGPIGAGLAKGVGMASGLGARAATMATDLNNQAGVGHHNHYPDFTAVGGGQPRSSDTKPPRRPQGGPDDGGPADGSPGTPQPQAPAGPHPDDTPRGPEGGGPASTPPPAPKPPPASNPSAPAAGSGGGSGAGGGAGAAAAEVPPIVV